MALTLQSTPRSPRDYVVGLAGQSLPDLLNYRAGAAEFIARLIEKTPNASADLIDLASGGSFAVYDHKIEAGSSSGYWTRAADPGDTGQLIKFYGDIVAGLANTIDVLCWGQGEADSGILTDAEDNAAMTGRMAAYQSALETIFAEFIAMAQAAETPKTPAILINPVGRRSGADTRWGLERIRQIHLGLIASNANIHHGGEHYDLELSDSVHPSREQLKIYARRWADAIAIHVLGETANLTLGPKILSVGFDTGSPTLVNLDIGYEPSEAAYAAPFHKPADPEALAIADADTPFVPIAITGSDWIGDTLQLSLAAPLSASGPVVYAPFGEVAFSDRANLIRTIHEDPDEEKPLRSFYRPPTP